MSVVAQSLRELSERRGWAGPGKCFELQTVGGSWRATSAPEGSPPLPSGKTRGQKPRPGCARQASNPPAASATPELARQDGRFTLGPATAGQPETDMGLDACVRRLQLTDLQQENDQMKHEIAALRAQLTAGEGVKLEKQVKGLTTEVAQHRKKAERLRSKSKVTQKEVESLHRTLHDANREIAKLRQKLKGSRHTRKVHQALFKMSCKNVEVLQANCKKAKHTAFCMSTLCDGARKDLHGARKDLEECQEKAAECQTEAEKKVEEVMDAKRALAVSAAEEIERLRDEIHTVAHGAECELERLRGLLRKQRAKSRPPLGRRALTIDIPLQEATPRYSEVPLHPQQDSDRTNRRLALDSVAPTPKIPLPSRETLSIIESGSVRLP